jgi:hypothetical protein
VGSSGATDLRGGADLAAVGRGRRWPPAGRAAVWALGTLAVACALFTCYLLQSRTVAAGSDGASQELQAWDMLHGNPLLRGWWVTDVPLYTTELPQYALVERLFGLSADVMHIAGAMTYTLLVTLAAFLARGRARGRDGLVRAAVAGGVMLAPQLSGSGTFLLGPDHVGTGVPVLALLLFVDLAGRRWFVPVVTGFALAWIAVADAMAVFVAAVPLALVYAVRAMRGPGEPGEATGTGESRGGALRARWFEVSMAGAAVASIPVEIGATRVIQAAGGWRVHGLQTALASGGMLAGNLRLTVRGLLELFGADVFDAGSALGVVFAVVHLLGVFAVLYGFIGALRRFFRRDAVIESVLVTGIVIDVAAYLSGVQAVNLLSTREIAPVLPFGAVLAGRILGPRLAGMARMVPLVAAALACYAAMLGYAAAQPAPPPQYADLATWLTAHHFTSGLSGYSQANIVTAETGGRVSVRPVVDSGPFVAGRLWNSSAGWFDPARHSADFLVLSSAGSYEVNEPNAVATFGPPSQTYRYREYTILVWRGDLLARLHGALG